MADSDDEYDRGRRGSRDKFRRERSDYNSRSRSGRDDWDRRRGDSGSWSDRDRDRRRRDHRDYDSGQRRGRRDGSPPYKRMKRDWDDGMYRDYGMPLHMPHPGPWSHPMIEGGRGSDHVDYQTQPHMLSFREYLNAQEKEIEETQAVQKYTEYKKDFHRKLISDFFDAHKDEEWLRIKYHPVDSVKHQEEQKAFVLQRKRVFFKLLEMGQIDMVSLDIENQKDIVKTLDAAVILLEGGTALDLQSLDQEPPASANQSINTSNINTSVSQESEEKDESKETEMTMTTTEDETNESEVKDKEGEGKTKEEMEVLEEKANGIETKDGMQETPTKDTKATDKTKEQPITETEASLTETDSSMEEGKTVIDEPKLETDKSSEIQPRPLHATKSIYIRTLAPNIKISEVVEFAQKIPGYLRVAFAEPQAERRFHRRGWITFKYDVDIKDICTQLNNTRVGDFELNMMVNRDFTNRVRHVSGFTAAQQLAQRDLKTAIILIRYLDDRTGLWKVEGEQQSNPLLPKVEEVLESMSSCDEWISDKAVEENVGQKEEGETEEGEEKQDAVSLERNTKLLQALDRALLYLRIVHCLDYYDAKEYPFEDNMPNRCCILHVRGILPSKASKSEVIEYWNAFQQKLDPFFKKHETVQDEKALELGLKDPEKEVQAFIKSNTQELAKDKWLCPLSGKKFRGPEFIVKHIQNKHSEKLENVKYEAEFLNAYIRDPNRPNLPPAPQSSSHSGDRVEMGPPGPMSWGRRPMYGAPFGRFPFGPEMFPSPGFIMPRRGRQDPRGIRDYRDLDAPEEIDV